MLLVVDENIRLRLNGVTRNGKALSNRCRD